MTKIYEALENADRDRGEMTQDAAPRATRSALPRSLEEKLLALYQRVESSSDAPGGRVVAFVGVHAGSESSNLVCEFAHLAAGRLLKRVLLLAAYPSSVSEQDSRRHRPARLGRMCWKAASRWTT